MSSSCLVHSFKCSNFDKEKFFHSISAPHNWPSKIRYITQNVSFADERIDSIEHFPMLRSSILLKKLPKNHPAYSPRPTQGFGVFATKFIPKGKIVGEYCGILRKKARKCYSDYCVSLNDVWCVDAGLVGNEVL